MTTGTDGSARSPQVFISYRREDAADAAGRLYDRLQEAFGDRIFMDVDNIPPGVDFVQAIDTAVGECDVFLAVIGKKWLTARDNARRQRRLELPEDFVRLELLAALRRADVWVIPVLVHGARMPSSAELPDDLTAFARRNGVSVTHTNWASDVGGLVRSIQGLANRKEADERARAIGDAQRRQADEKARELREAEAGPAEVAPAPEPAPKPLVDGSPGTAGFEDDILLVHTWLPLAGKDRRDAVIEHVRPLPVDAHASFIDHARTMYANVLSDIERHEADESSAWGSIIPDRIAYMNARLATGQRDPDWVAKLHELQAYAELFADVATVSEEALVARREGAAGTGGAAGRAADIEAMLDEFTETRVMPHGLMEQLGQIDDPALMDRLLEKLKAAQLIGADRRPGPQIADHYVDGPDRYSLWWPLYGPGLSLPVAFEDLDRPTQFHVLWAEFSYRIAEAGALRNAGSLDEAHDVFQECLERAAQLNVGVLKEQSYEGLMTVAERRGDREAVQRYLHLAQQEHLRANR